MEENLKIFKSHFWPEKSTNIGPSVNTGNLVTTYTIYRIINRPGVAGAVLQSPPSLTH